ncbi:MAG: hypothetical protein GY862_34905 [Gammaproteobacteria bacterium]|nr:hypothetical protein [Gammaproteobacteria bacterium]
MNLDQISDHDLVLEIYRRIKGEDEMSMFRNYCYRAALRPVFTVFDKADIDAANVRMYRRPDWKQLEAERDAALAHFPGP